MHSVWTGRRRWWVLFALAAVVASVLILHAGAPWTFSVDDWGMILYRRSGGWSAFMAPHNGNLEPALVGLYRLLFGVAGIDHFGVYRCVELAFHLAFCALLFAYLRTRLPSALAFLATLPVLFVAYGYSVLVWTYDVVWIVPLACMLGVFMLRDRGSRRGAPLTLLLLLLAVAASGPMAAVLVVVAVATALDRARWREWWAVAVPLGAYALWALLLRSHIDTPASLRAVPGAIGFGDTERNLLAFGMHKSGLPHLPNALLKTSDAAAGGLLGTHTTSYWPLVLVAAAVALLVWRRRRIPPRALACFAGLVTTWVLVGLFRRPDEYGANRYVYAGTVFLVLTLAELARMYRPRPAVVAVLGAAVLAILVSDVRELRHAPRFVAPFFDGARSELRQLQCTPGLPPATPAKSPLLPLVTSGPLRVSVHDLGSPVGPCAVLR